MRFSLQLSVPSGSLLTFPYCSMLSRAAAQATSLLLSLVAFFLSFLKKLLTQNLKRFFGMTTVFFIPDLTGKHFFHNFSLLGFLYFTIFIQYTEGRHARKT